MSTFETDIRKFLVSLAPAGAAIGAAIADPSNATIAAAVVAALGSFGVWATPRKKG